MPWSVLNPDVNHRRRIGHQMEPIRVSPAVVNGVNGAFLIKGRHRSSIFASQGMCSFGSYLGGLISLIQGLVVIPRGS